MNIRKATPRDFEFYYSLKCEKTAVYWGGFDKAPQYDVLSSHFHKLISGQICNRTFYIAEDDQQSVGYLQLSRNNEAEIEIGYGVSERFSGKGY